MQSLDQTSPTEPLSVAFIHPDLGIGGAERLIVDAAAGLRKKGHHVRIYTSHHDPRHCFEETRDGTLDVQVLGDWMPRTVAGKGYIVFAILRNLWLSVLLLLSHNQFHQPYDVIVVDQLSISIPLLRWTGSKILFYCHFPDKLLTKRESALKRLYRMPVDYLEELTTRMSDEILVNSKFTRQVFKDSFRSIQRVPKVLYPSIHLESYDKQVDETDPSVAMLKSPKKTFVSINRFERKKNVGLAIRAFAQLAERYASDFANLRLVVAGGYDKRSIENREHHLELDRLAQELGLSTATVFPGEVQDVGDAQVLFLLSFNEAQRTFLLASSFGLLYTPSNEHFGIVPVEAMYGRLPVVAVNNGGPTESILHEKTGFLCESDPAAFATAMVQILRGQPLSRDVLGQQGRAHAQARFSLDTFVNQLEGYVVELKTATNSEALWTSASFWVLMLLCLAVPGYFLGRR
ncbi:uncharacterized protein BJ171DRAFT_304047 [Polychytrium aggregatum]|uniref:uncharacterized protein n=1 Tax=Polychytrium aggregatum TaxID=110093 RepID=UPI0022FEE451|nr:uncharacterized protein BJ171DRAFT_304047 [Polychytrium aggregatum]KAI9193184.1 hypothetical protein BJ171DRAFT_304047 [Polychytrium aggregatum]